MNKSLERVRDRERENTNTYAIYFLITLGLIQFISIFVYYGSLLSPPLILHIIAISSFGIYLALFWIIPRLAHAEVEVNIPDRILDLIQKSWNEGLDSYEREELRLWFEESEYLEGDG